MGWGWRGGWRCPTEHISFQNHSLAPKPPAWLGKMGSDSVVWGKRRDPAVLVGLCRLHVHAAHTRSSPLRSPWDLFAPSGVSPTSTAGCRGHPRNLGNSTEVFSHCFGLLRKPHESDPGCDLCAPSGALGGSLFASEKKCCRDPTYDSFWGKSEPPALFLTWGYQTMGLNRWRFSFLPVELAK